MSNDESVTLTRCGRVFELQLGRTYAVRQLSRMFNVDPTTLWLRDTFNNRAYFPTNDDTFDLKAEGVTSFAELVVEGENVSSASVNRTGPSTITLSTGNSSTRSSSPSYPGFTPVVSQGRRSTTATGGYSLKVVQARISCISGGRPQFQKLGQTFIVLGESTANIHHISSAVKTEFGDDHIVVTADGLEVRDSSGTQGMY